MDYSDSGNLEYQLTDESEISTTKELSYDNKLECFTNDPSKINSNANNVLNIDVPSGSTTSGLRMTKRKSSKCNIESTAFQNKNSRKTEGKKTTSLPEKSDTCELQGSKIYRNTYNMMRFHCPKCIKDLSLMDIAYVRHEPRNCKICSTRIKYGCKECNNIYISRIGIQKHIKLEHGDAKHFQCAHCKFKTNWRENVKKHLFKKHGFVTNVNVHSPLKYIYEGMQFYCSTCKKKLISEETANCAERKAKYCKKCKTVIWFACKRCNKVFKCINSIKRHVKYCSKSPSF